VSQIIALHAFALASGATIALGALLLALLKLRDFLDWVSTPSSSVLVATRPFQVQQTERSAIESIIKEMETYGLD
jgi:hypothetical protein